MLFNKCFDHSGYLMLLQNKIKYFYYLQRWPKFLENLTDLKILTFLASKTWFNFIMFMKHADGLLWAQQISGEVSRTVFIHF